MLIDRVAVKGLFGLFNHEVRLKDIDHITVIHGPNGFGKSVLLRLIDASFNGEYELLRSTPFQELTIGFNNQNKLVVTRTETKSQPADITVRLDEPNREPQSFRPFRPESSDPFATPLVVSGKTDAFSKYLLTYGRQKTIDEPDWLKQVKGAIDVRLITTDRLTIAKPTEPLTASIGNEPQIVPAVKEYATEVAAEITAKLAEYADISQKLDRTFPQRLVGPAVPSLEPAELNRRLSALEQKRSRLTAAGLLERESEESFATFPQASATERARPVLTIYVQDTEQKLAVFDDLLNRIELFRELIDGKFLYKEIFFHKELGFVFFVRKTKQVLQPNQLSSGEQHELVLLYRLIFRISRPTLILLDEPEISLHVAWLERFLPDLGRITKLSPIDVLIATHSAELIGDRRDLLVELTGPSQDAA